MDNPTASRIGQKLSHYEVLEEIGRGGMGIVYRARDTKLGREVAIKVLPFDATGSREVRRTRFAREARLLASLNHPNIAAIHGFETSESVDFLVLELVPGETLAEKLKVGAIGVDEALELAFQITNALDAAHETGVIHRDLKPANIKITPDGRIKVLDFGLAKALEVDPSSGPSLSDSPTLSQAATREGVILGTAPYMSPEQARAKTVDKRTDIFSFGAVLYEMLTGRPPFWGEDVSEILAAVIKSDPDWSGLPANIDPGIRKLLVGCLQKDPKERRRDIGDVRVELRELLGRGGVTETLALRTEVGAGVSNLLLVALLALLVGGIAAWMMKPSPPRAVTRLDMILPPDQQFQDFFGYGFAIAPDARRLAYSVFQDRLYLHDFDQGQASPIRGTEGGGFSLFFSPDGDWLGFWADGKLMKVALSGGAPVTICEIDPIAGATWGVDDDIVLGMNAQGIWRVSANGGEPEVLVTVDTEKGELSQSPSILPGGNSILFALAQRANWEAASVVVQSLGTGERKVLVEGGADARYVPTGHLVYALGSSLFAVPLDLARLELAGNPVPIVEDVGRALGTIYTGAAHFSFSDSGTLVYAPEEPATDRRLVWVDREGNATPLTESRHMYQHLSLSPDGRRLALWIEDRGKSDIWIHDIDRDTSSRLTTQGNNVSPIWSQDGQWVVFGSDRDGDYDLYRKRVDADESAEKLLTRELRQWPVGWSHDGETLLYQELTPSSDRDIWALPLAGGEGETRPLLQSAFQEHYATLSPNGQWLAYTSNLSGQTEIYVQQFPGTGKRWKISTDGGDEPLWSPDGRELFFTTANRRRLMSVDVTTEPELRAGTPRLLFETPDLTGTSRSLYALAPDGERFIMIWRGDDPNSLAGRELKVVLNWFSELERLAPRD